MICCPSQFSTCFVHAIVSVQLTVFEFSSLLHQGSCSDAQRIDMDGLYKMSFHPFFIREVVLTQTNPIHKTTVSKLGFHPFFIREVVLTRKKTIRILRGKCKFPSLLHQGSCSDLSPSISKPDVSIVSIPSSSGKLF